MNDFISRIFCDLESIVKNEFKNFEYIEKCIRKIENFIPFNEYAFKEDSIDYHEHVIVSFENFTSEFIQNNNIKRLEDEKLQSSLGILYILHCICYLNIELRQKETTEDKGNIVKCINEKTEAPKELISLKNLKVIEACVQYIMYTCFLSSLDEFAVKYIRLKAIQENFAFKKKLEISLHNSHKILFMTLKHLLPLFKHKQFGPQLQDKYIFEILCGLLQLSFSSSDVTEFPDDVIFCREELNDFLQNNPLHFLKAIFLIMGINMHTKQNNYFQKVCYSLYVRRFLLKEHSGLQLIIDAAISVDPSSNLERKEAIASLISTSKIPKEEELFRVIGPQIIHLLNEKKIKTDVFHILALILCQLSKRNPKLSQISVFQPFLAPLANISQDGFVSEESSGEDLISLITILHKLFIEILPPDEELINILRPVVCFIAEISSLPPTCHIKSKAQALVLRYLTHLEDDNAVSVLLAIVGLNDCEDILSVNPRQKFVARINSIGIEEQCLANEWSEINERKIQCLVEILDKFQQNDVIFKFFQKLTACIDFTILNNIDTNPCLLLADEDVTEIKFEKIRMLSLIVGFLCTASESDTLTSKIFDNLSSSLGIFETLLQIHHQECLDFELSQIKDSYLMSCIMLLSSYVTNFLRKEKNKSEDWNEFRIFVPTLKELLKNSKNAALSLLAEQLLRMILTRGKICTVTGESSSFESDNNPTASGRLSNTSNVGEKVKQTDRVASTSKCNAQSTATTTAHNRSSSAKQNNPSLSSFCEALLDICSPHIPVRGHALISLTKLIDAGDSEALNNTEKILPLFEHHLRDEDSYIYLSAIKGLASLSSKFPQKVITILIQELQSSNQNTETRLKVIEVLTETSRGLGPFLPKYKNLFLNCLLNGVKDEDFLIRSSCLSNLGEVCKELRFSIEAEKFEIFSLVEHTIINERSIEVKRAAVLLVTLLLRGLGKDALKVLHSLILDLYRSLKRLILTENDVVLVMHAELAMEEINLFTREFLLPKTNLTKKIYVTEIPPNLL